MNLKNNDGLTTVFVILLTVVLLMFGVGVITISLSSENLSEKKHEWVTSYYDLEKLMADELSETNLKLLALQSALKDEEDFKTLYIESIKSDFITFEKDDILYLELLADKGQEKYLMAELEILLPDGSESLNDFALKLPFKVVTYTEVQDLFDYEDIPYENPFIPNGDE